MINRISVRNFQSLHHVELTLDRFTVIVGASSSGKSALTRAIRMLTSNARGHAFITHGEKIATVTAETDKGQITLKRGKSTADNEYIVIPAGGDPTQQRTYTKLSAEVPPEVSEFIGIPAKDPLNYAGQFDMPYLLKASPAQVAVTLGALTNVNVIFDAARESNKRKLAAAATLKLRATDLQLIMEKAEGYKDLKGHMAALAEAEELIQASQELQEAVSRLRTLMGTTDEAEAVIERTEALVGLHIPDDSDIRETAAKITRLQYRIEMIEGFEETIERTEHLAQIVIPDDAKITAASQQLFKYRAVLSNLRDHSTELKAAQDSLAQATTEEQELAELYTATLQDAGTCPTCLQRTDHIGELTHA